MLKFLNKELDKLNHEIDELTLEKEEIIKKSEELGMMLKSVDRCKAVNEQIKVSGHRALLYTLFILGTIPVTCLAICILPAVLICDVAFGIVDIIELTSVVTNLVEKQKIKKRYGKITNEEIYEISRESDKCDDQYVGTSTLIMIKERDAEVLKSIINSDNVLEELKKYPSILRDCLENEFNEYLREVKSMKPENIHLTATSNNKAYQLKKN